MTTQDFAKHMPDYLDLLNAFRKLGYSTTSAIADLCDNPYDAGATKCWVSVKKGVNVIDNIVISDNGSGMTQYELQKALVPASTGRIRKFTNELGCFGVGMVSAGLSLGNKIEVYTRGEEGDFYSYIDWDEKFLSNNPVNEIRRCTADESATVLKPYLHGSKTGTVIWITKTSIAQTRYESLLKQLEFHLGVTYFGLQDKYEVFINLAPVKAWDILEANKCADVSAVHTFKVSKIVNNKRIEGNISLQLSYIWAENAERPYPSIMGRTGENQGGALVRNGRTLAYGTMMGIEAKTPLHNALRFRVSYDNPELDSVVFSLNVQKDDCQIVDKEVWDWLANHVKTYISKVVRPLNKRYRKSKVAKTPSSGSRTRLPLNVERVKFMANHQLVKKLLSTDTTKLTSPIAIATLCELKTMAEKVNTSSIQALKAHNKVVKATDEATN